jgi:hypothetical protein
MTAKLYCRKRRRFPTIDAVLWAEAALARFYGVKRATIKDFGVERLVGLSEPARRVLLGVGSPPGTVPAPVRLPKVDFLHLAFVRYGAGARGLTLRKRIWIA